MSKKFNAVIIAAGEISDIYYSRHDSDCVIAADRGYLSAMSIGVNPDRVIGDFDSLGEIPEHEYLTVLPVEKDDTDTAYAVKLALGMGYERIFILGGLGGRLDHTLANIQMLSYIARESGVGYLVSGSEAMCVIRDREVTVHGKPGQTVSVFSLSERSSDVSETGFKYTLDNAEIGSGFPIGVSNELVSERAEISVGSGELLIYARGDMRGFIEKNRLCDIQVQQKLNIYF